MNTWLKPFCIILAVILAIIALNSFVAILQDSSVILNGVTVVSDTVNGISRVIGSGTAAVSNVVTQIPYVSGISTFVWHFISNLVILVLAVAAICVVWRIITGRTVRI